MLIMVIQKHNNTITIVIQIQKLQEKERHTER